MNPTGALITLATMLLTLALLIGSGYLWGRSSRDGELAALADQLAQANDTAEDRTALAGALRHTLAEERERRRAQQELAVAELAAHADRIATLSATTERQRNELETRVNADEDCAPLRDLPVCAAVADGLFGRPATAGAH